MALEKDLVAARRIILALEEVVQAHLIERGSTRVGRDVATYANSWALCTVHHDGRIPADPAAVALFQFLVTRKLWLHGGWDGVDEVRGRQRRQFNALSGSALEQAQHQVACALRIGVLQQTIEGIHPLAGLFWIIIVKIRCNAVADEREVGVALGGVLLGHLNLLYKGLHSLLTRIRAHRSTMVVKPDLRGRAVRYIVITSIFTGFIGVKEGSLQTLRNWAKWWEGLQNGGIAPLRRVKGAGGR